MICLADNDIVLKRACCDLLHEAVVALEATLDKVYVLNTAIYKLLSPKKPGCARCGPGPFLVSWHLPGAWSSRRGGVAG